MIIYCSSVNNGSGSLTTNARNHLSGLRQSISANFGSQHQPPGVIPPSFTRPSIDLHSTLVSRKKGGRRYNFTIDVCDSPSSSDRVLEIRKLYKLFTLYISLESKFSVALCNRIILNEIRTRLPGYKGGYEFVKREGKGN